MIRLHFQFINIQTFLILLQGLRHRPSTVLLANGKIELYFNRLNLFELKKSLCR